MKILANDGISQSGIDALGKRGFEIITTKVAQNQLENYINEHTIDAILLSQPINHVPRWWGIKGVEIIHSQLICLKSNLQYQY